jgi:hypothetical protein
MHAISKWQYDVSLHFDSEVSLKGAIENISVFARQLPPNGKQPILLGEINFMLNPPLALERHIYTLSKNGYVCLGTFPYLLKFERE